MKQMNLERAFRMVEKCARARNDDVLLAESARLRQAFTLLSGMPRDERAKAKDSEVFDADNATVDEIMTEVAKYVIGQEKGARQIVEFLLMKKRLRRLLDEGVASHDLPEARAMLICGASASGKSHIIKTIARVLGMKLFNISYASLTGCGWRGTSVIDVLVEVCEFQKENPEAFCIVAFDECDKHTRSGTNLEISFDPATDLLKVLDATSGSFEFTSEQGEKEQYVADLTKVGIIFAGAFSGIEGIIARRLGSQAGGSFGFGIGDEGLLVKTMDKNALRARLAPEDLVSYGILSEMVGRYGSIVALPTLTDEELVSVIRDAEHSILKRFTRLLSRNVSVCMSNKAAHHLANASAASEIGVRLAEGTISSLMAEATSFASTTESVRSIYLTFDENTSELQLRYRMNDGSLRHKRSTR